MSQSFFIHTPLKVLSLAPFHYIVAEEPGLTINHLRPQSIKQHETMKTVWFGLLHDFSPYKLTTAPTLAPDKRLTSPTRDWAYKLPLSGASGL